MRIGHNYLPAFQIFPQLAHEVVKSENDNSAEIIIPTLVPNEQINISYLYFPPTVYSQINTYCKSDEMYAKHINVIPTAQIGKSLQIVTSGVLFVGASTIVYWLFCWLIDIIRNGT